MRFPYLLEIKQKLFFHAQKGGPSRGAMLRLWCDKLLINNGKMRSGPGGQAGAKSGVRAGLPRDGFGPLSASILGRPRARRGRAPPAGRTRPLPEGRRPGGGPIVVFLREPQRHRPCFRPPSAPFAVARAGAGRACCCRAKRHRNSHCYTSERRFKTRRPFLTLTGRPRGGPAAGAPQWTS